MNYAVCRVILNDSLFFFPSPSLLWSPPQGSKRLWPSSSSSWSGLLAPVVSTGYAAAQCVSARPPGGGSCPPPLQAPGHPRLTPRCLGPARAPPPASPRLAEGRLHAVAAAGLGLALGLCAISILAIFSSRRSAVGFTWLHFCGSQGDTCVYYSVTGCRSTHSS